jgi:hypothetical protein
VAELIVMLGEFGNVSVINAQLRFAHKNIAVPEVYKQISVIGLESVLDAQNLELLSVFGDLGCLHLLEQLDYFLRTGALDLAS